MKRVNLLIMIIASMLIFASCENSSSVANQSADKVMAQQTAQQMVEANKQIGMPAIKNFQERKQAKMIFEARDDENLICYAYLMNTMTGQVGQFLGKCIGYGLPYSVQFTNPEKVKKMDGDFGQYASESVYTIPQADPNGLFMPTGLSATWLFLLDEKGKPHPVYVEPEIIVSPFKLK